jgi:uncharacterized protein (TIGR01777 family)
MTTALILLALQGVLGAFDNVWNHEWHERLPSRPGARRELILHAARGALYAPVFLGFGWLKLGGLYGWAFIAILAVELGITLADFVEEDRTRKLSGLERMTHTVLTLNYGGFLALAAPALIAAALQPTDIALVDRGWIGWLMTFYAAGSFGFAMREALAARRLGRMSAAAPIAAPALASGRTVLITGGTGFIGRAVTRRLVERGDRVIVLTRDAAAARETLGPVPMPVESLAEIPGDTAIDGIVNLAGAPIFGPLWTKARKRTLVTSRVAATAELAAWIAGLSKRPAVLVSASAIGWYGTGDAPRDETAPVGSDFPAILCNAWEREAARAVALGLRVCRLRLGVVLGSEGGMLAGLLPSFRLGLGARIGDGRQWVSWIHRDDAVEMIVRALADPLFTGVINATAPEPVRQAAFAEGLARVLHRPLWLRLPAGLLRAGLGEMAELLTEGQAVLPRRAIEIGFNFRCPELEPALADLFHRPAPREGATMRLLDNLLT